MVLVPPPLAFPLRSPPHALSSQKFLMCNNVPSVGFMCVMVCGLRLSYCFRSFCYYHNCNICKAKLISVIMDKQPHKKLCYLIFLLLDCVWASCEHAKWRRIVLMLDLVEERTEVGRDWCVCGRVGLRGAVASPPLSASTLPISYQVVL